MIKIVIIGAYPLLKQGLKMQIELDPNLQVVAELNTEPDLFDRVRQLSPDVALVDIDSPDDEGVVIAQGLRAAFPSLPIIILSMKDDKTTQMRSQRVGAVIFVIKQANTTALVNAIHDAVSPQG